MALHFGCCPTELEEDQVVDYLNLLQKSHKTPSDSYFKHTVYGLRMLCKTEGIKGHEIGLPSIQRPKKLPVVLSNLEFIRRHALHILPKRFVRIRHFGYLSSTWKRGKLKSLQQVMCKDTNTRVPKNIPQVITRKCPCCKSGQMIILLTFDSRGPPLSYLKAVSQQNHCLVSL